MPNCFIIEGAVERAVYREAKEVDQSDKRTTPGIPTWSPTVVLTWPDDA
jgi:hypothetical protein